MQKVELVNNNLKIFISKDNGLIKCTGRYLYTNFPIETRNPILLLRKSNAVMNLILHLHKKNGHVGVKHTLSLLREHFWIN